MNRPARLFVVSLAILVAPEPLWAHSGPPFPIVTDVIRGPYLISIWTDPDATDDGSAGGQFWVVLALTPKAAPVPPETRVTVMVRPETGPMNRVNPAGIVEKMRALASPVRDDPANQFGAVVMEREGPYLVRVTIDGPLGPAVIETRVDATYDLRPPPYMLAWYLAPFLLAGLLWTRLILRRRKVPRKR
jgi:hypothetical protein